MHFVFHRMHTGTRICVYIFIFHFRWTFSYCFWLSWNSHCLFAISQKMFAHFVSFSLLFFFFFSSCRYNLYLCVCCIFPEFVHSFAFRFSTASFSLAQIWNANGNAARWYILYVYTLQWADWCHHQCFSVYLCVLCWMAMIKRNDSEKAIAHSEKKIIKCTEVTKRDAHILFLSFFGENVFQNVCIRF